jgi:hypothetical protein
MNLKAAMVLVLAALCSQASHAGPIRLGQTALDTTFGPGVERDVIRLGPCAGRVNDPIRAIKLRVLRRAAEINRLVVVYGNGTREALPVREKFLAGTESRWIDLRGANRCVVGIGIAGETLSSPFVPAIVEIYGR